MTCPSDLRAIAHALGGEVVGRQVSCPGPGHSPRDRSLSVRLSADAPMGFIAFSHCGDDWMLCRDDVAARLGLDRGAWKRDRLERRAPRPGRPVDNDNADRTREALEYWNHSGDPRRTIVERYLNSRALDLPDDIAGSVIRWNARIGAMISLMRNIHTGEPQAILRTYLDRDGRKRTIFNREGKELGERLFKGPTGGAAVMLDSFNSVTDALVIGEGVETCLTGRQEGMGPSWALGSCGEIKKLPVVERVRSLTLHRERCERNAEASEICAARWIKAGREVFDAWPKFGKDINDAVRAMENVGE
jgi:putative DNA primase/helicase